MSGGVFQCLGNFCVSHRSTGRVEFTYGSRCVAAFDQAVKKKKSLGNREEEDEEIEGLSEEIPRKLIPTYIYVLCIDVLSLQPFLQLFLH